MLNSFDGTRLSEKKSLEATALFNLWTEIIPLREELENLNSCIMKWKVAACSPELEISEQCQIQNLTS